MLKIILWLVFAAVAMPALASTETLPATTSQPPIWREEPTATPSLPQLQANQQQIQQDLNQLLQQMGRLQAGLATLNQQTTQLSQHQPQTPQDLQQLQQIQQAQQQIQQEMGILNQQGGQLQQRLDALKQQMSLVNTPNATPATPQTTNTTTLVEPDSPSSQNSTVVWSTIETVKPGTTTVVPTVKVPLTTIAPPTHAPVQAAMTSLTTPITATAPKTPPSPVIKTAPRPANSSQSLQASILHWAQDPMLMLRIGGGFIALALLLVSLLLWPKSKRRSQPVIDTEPADLTELPPPITATIIEDNQEDLSAEYDFMNSEDAIPIRLDLARAYLEMGKYQEARDAIEPVFEKGDDQQHEEAKRLLRQIALAQVEA